MEENKKDVLILAIETSCDETAAAVVKNGREVFIKYHLYADQTAYIIWRRSTGNCIQKTYRED